MGRNLAVLATGLFLSAIAMASACEGNKPPLTPDDEHANPMGTDPPGMDAAATGAATATPASTAAPKK
jgi:hypothetical protein